MITSTIDIVCVSYNSTHLVADLLTSIRKFYTNRIYIIDGSDHNVYLEINDISKKFDNVNLVHFDFNIHHGPGMAWAIQNLPLSSSALFIDTDVIVLKGGFLESMLESLTESKYGVGMVNRINEDGFDVEYYSGSIAYLHPACMLCNVNIMRSWPMPTKHGAPMTAPMTALHLAGKSDLVVNIEWLKSDFGKNSDKHFLQHDWQGTVKNTGGYHLEEWQQQAQHNVNFDSVVMSLVPNTTQSLLQIQCSSGAFARVYKQNNPGCEYIGIDSSEKSTKIASFFCDKVFNNSLAELNVEFLSQFNFVEGWILIRALDELPNPKLVLNSIRQAMKPDAFLIVSVRNFQHWHNQLALSSGDFRKISQKFDILLKNQFTRNSVISLLSECGFSIKNGVQLMQYPAMNEEIENAIRSLAVCDGGDANAAVSDANATDYIFKVVPLPLN